MILRQSTARTAILDLLARDGGWCVGLYISRHAHVPSGVMYPALDWLERHGFIESTFVDGPYPRRRLYRRTYL